MSDQVVTTLTIDADTGGAAKYEQAMDGAAKAAERTAKSLDALYNSSQAANDNIKSLQGNADAANKAAVSFHFAGVESLEMTNHLRQAVVVAYAFSPAFRELANPVIATSIRATGTALSAMAPAAAAATGAALRGFAPLLATVGRVALPIMLIKDAFDAMNAVTELGAEKIKEFTELASNAGSAGVGNDFFQRQTLGAKELRLEAGKATEAVKRFNEVTIEKLGGSAFDRRVAELRDAGNFQGNPGVASLAQATSVEEKYRATVLLITTAMERGERLAALDLSEKFLPPELQTRLRANSGFLTQMQETADRIKPADIISDEQISYALVLKKRLDDAHETLNDKFKPVQKDLTQLGLNYQESWVGIVEVMAGGVTKANDLYTALKGIPALFAEAGNASFWDKIAKYGTRPEGLVLRGEPGFETQDPARAALGAGLNNPNAVRQAMLQTTNVSYALRPDISKAPAGLGKESQANDQLDRAIEQLEKHTARTEADTKAQGLGVRAFAQQRASAKPVIETAELRMAA